MCRVGTGIFVFELLQRKAVTKWCKLAKERLAGPELGVFLTWPGCSQRTDYRGGREPRAPVPVSCSRGIYSTVLC